MAYTIVDLLDKLIMIEQKGCNLYKNMTFMASEIPKIKTVAEILTKEEERHVAYYQSLKEKALGSPEVEIELDIYDRVSQLLIEFKRKIVLPQMGTVQELLKFALGFEKENVALLLDIQGRLVKKEEDTSSLSYKTISKIIEEEQKHVKNLEIYVKA